MRIHNTPGSKERLYEMMSNVNKVKLNENSWQKNLNQTLSTAIDKLKSGALKIEQGGSNKTTMQTIDDTIYVGINGYDSNKNMYNFNFKINTTEGDQDDVYNVQDVELEKFYYQNPQGEKVFDVNEDDLIDFNRQHGSELYDIIEKYVDVDIQPGEEYDEMSESKFENKKHSEPFGHDKSKYQDGSGYVDEKPVNSKLRVKSDKINKYLQEENINRLKSDKKTNNLNEGKYVNHNGIMKWVISENDNNNDVDYLDGEKLMKQSYSSLMRDLDFSKLANAYELLLNYSKKNPRSYTDKLDSTLGNVRNLIVDYVREKKGLDVSDEDVQNFFTSLTQRFSPSSIKEEEDPCWDDHEMIGMKQKDGKEVPNCVPKNENETPEEEVPALDVNDVDNDGDNLEGGLGDDASVMEFDPEQILKGIEVEMEHTKDPKVALEIALDHLEEFSDYYTRLENMESNAELNISPERGCGSVETDLTNPDMGMGSPAEMKKKMEDTDLTDQLLGFDASTPNQQDEERYLELSEKDFDSLTEEEKDEFYNLWEQFN